MADNRNNSANKRILGLAPNRVKGRIVCAGLQMGNLAAAAGIARSTLSEYCAGRYRAADTQIAIWQAFRELTGQAVSLQAFWGELLSQEIAA